MADFTTPQINVLRTLLSFPISYAQGLTKALYDKGILTPDEVRAAVDAVRAGRSGATVEKALVPEREDFEDELKRLLEGIAPDSH